jgi:hypothetical protein
LLSFCINGLSGKDTVFILPVKRLFKFVLLNRGGRQIPVFGADKTVRSSLLCVFMRKVGLPNGFKLIFRFEYPKDFI